MSDEEIISLLVKGRERFRHLVQVYRNERAKKLDGGSPSVNSLQEVDRVLSSALGHLNRLPEKPTDACMDNEKRAYAGCLLKEIGDLLESVMVLDREIRGSYSSKPSDPAPSGLARNRAIRSYATA